MSAFPRLKTGAVAQYPAGRSAAYSTDEFRFLDGSRQTYRQRGRAARRWVIELALLDDTEMSELCDFFQSQQGRFGTFSFTDPWDGTVYPNCSFGDDELLLQLSDEGRGSLRVVIEENKD
ncbi:MAG: DUF2460 domain-containing protein [Acidobacteriota bacterium]